MRAAAQRPEERAARAPAAAPADVRDALFGGLRGRRFACALTACERGVLAGARRLTAAAAGLGVEVECVSEEGALLEPGAAILRGRGDAWQVARAEEQLIALVAKASGVATAAAQLVSRARGRARVVCGAWKKVPAEVRAELREAAALGGAAPRILDSAFVYLDKNGVRMLGGVAPAVRRARRQPDRAVVVQLRGETDGIAAEALAAAAEGADVLMVDTGVLADLAAVADLSAAGRLGANVRVAFAGGVDASKLDQAIEAGAEIVDVGRAILDAPMLDLRLDVT